MSRLRTGEVLPPTPAAAPLAGYILYQGALNMGRGLEQLIDAMPQVAGRLVICGEGDLSAALREQAERLASLVAPMVLDRIARSRSVSIKGRSR